MASPEPMETEGIGQAPDDVVVPPKQIREVIEKVGGYVARNGPVFEERVRVKERGNQKFNFLNEKDAYHTYWLWRKSEIKAGRGTDISAGSIGKAPTPASAQPEKPKGPQQPPEFHFSARMPNISGQDMDVVKLTALWVAKNGRSFMTTLSQKESTNFQFDFLRPQHSLYQFFSRLVDQYSELLNARGSDTQKAEDARISDLSHNIKNKFHILDRAKQRAEWVRYQEREKQKQEENAETEKIAYAQIDWHEFTLVETVTFDDTDDLVEHARPITLSDLQSASLEHKAAITIAPNMRIEEAMPTDEPYFNGYTPQPPQLPSQGAPQLMPSPFAPPPQPTQSSAIPSQAMSPQPPFTAHPGLPTPARPSSVTPANAPMKIRSDYVPRAAATRAAMSATHAICPNCKQAVPYAELQEHMRIELLDPQWKEQRAKADQRYSTTNLSTAEVANNLKRLASQRTDVFDAGVVRANAPGLDGGTGNNVANDAERERKRIAVGLGPDGVMQGHPVNIEEQLRRIQEKAAGGRL